MLELNLLHGPKRCLEQDDTLQIPLEVVTVWARMLHLSHAPKDGGLRVVILSGLPVVIKAV